MSDRHSDIDSGFFIRALASLPNKSDRIRVYEELFRIYHRDRRARIEVPQVWNSVQERGDRISKRFKEARAEAAARPREFPTIVQIQLRSLTRSFEKVAEARRQKKEQEALQRATKSLQERRGRITKQQSEEAQAEAEALVEARLKSLEHWLAFSA
jgi:hypothetical protein